MTNTLLYFFVSYVIGSLPTGYLAALSMGRGSIFNPGERTPKNTGDIFALLGIKMGLFVTFLDLLKGLIVAGPLDTWIIGPHIEHDWTIVSTGGLLAVIGHCNSPWLGFRGGRGVAPSFGVLFMILPGPALISAIIWGCLSFWGLSTSPGAVSAAAAMPVISVPWVMFYQNEKLYYLFPVAFLSLWTLFEHRKNLKAYLGIKD